jgi:DNA helicase-2/ATP-dependent DNA helicase PcrA
MNRLEEAKTRLRKNDKQWEAFTRIGHCAVLAPPGSGKTQLLTARAAQSLLLGEITAPRGLACVTMTNEATEELRRRLSHFGVRQSANLFVGTVHSFAMNRIVRPYGALTGRNVLEGRHLASHRVEAEAREAALDALDFAERDRFLAQSTMNVARQRMDLSGHVLLGGPRIAALARRYEQELAVRESYDFTSVIASAVDIIEQNLWVAEVVSATFGEIYVDEYQDLAPGLDRIVRAISLRKGSHTRLFCVGDPDQSIYGFSGAHPALLRHLANEPHVHKVALEQNYRSGQQIINSALAALGESRTIHPAGSGGLVTLHPGQRTVAAQVDYTSSLVSKILATGTPPDEIVVISAWSKDRDLVSESLRNSGVPVYARTDDHWRTTTLTAAFESSASWVASRQAQNRSLSAVLPVFDQHLVGNDKLHKHERLKKLVSALLGSSGDLLARDFVSPIAAILLDDVATIREDDKNNIDRMLTAIGQAGPLAGMTVRDLGLRARAPGHVMTSTIHGAKGLEFDAVIISGADTASLIGFNPTSEEFAEGRRKLYVSITRARKSVDVIYCVTRLSGRGKPYPVDVPPFVLELGNQGRPGS